MIFMYHQPASRRALRHLYYPRKHVSSPVVYTPTYHQFLARQRQGRRFRVRDRRQRTLQGRHSWNMCYSTNIDMTPIRQLVTYKCPGLASVGQIGYFPLQLFHAFP